MSATYLTHHRPWFGHPNNMFEEYKIRSAILHIPFHPRVTFCLSVPNILFGIFFSNSLFSFLLVFDINVILSV
jgi:hypothetical protein